MLRTYQAGEAEAFRAGFDLSQEGFNSEYGGPTNEWLDVHYRAWRLGEPLPHECDAPSPVADEHSSPDYRHFPCSQPRDHQGTHSWESEGTNA